MLADPQQVISLNRSAICKRILLISLNFCAQYNFPISQNAFENVEKFNYLSSILNADNKMNIEIAERILKAIILCQCKTNKSKFLKKNAKMKIYKTMIRPVVMYWSETWTLTAKDENNLLIFVRQIGKYFFLSILTLYGEYEITRRLIHY